MRSEALGAFLPYAVAFANEDARARAAAASWSSTT